MVEMLMKVVVMSNPAIAGQIDLETMTLRDTSSTSPAPSNDTSTPLQPLDGTENMSDADQTESGEQNDIPSQAAEIRMENDADKRKDRARETQKRPPPPSDGVPSNKMTGPKSGSEVDEKQRSRSGSTSRVRTKQSWTDT